MGGKENSVKATHGLGVSGSRVLLSPITMNNEEDFIGQLFRLINSAYDDDVPMSEVYGALGLAQTKMEDDLQTAIGEKRDFGSSGSDFRIDDDEEFF